MKHSVLIIDDEEAVCWALQRALTQEGHRVSVAASAEEGLKAASLQRPDVVLLDVRLPGMDGLTALGKLRQMTDDAPILVMTAFGNLNTAVQAVAGGAFDYLAKPFDLSQALEAVERALQRRKKEPATSEDISPVGPDELVGRSPAMQSVFKRIALVAPRDACVLITGESGTGKELVARAIHRHSNRRERPFLPIHIAALNPGLVESELFGHVKGAFTGATQSRPGLLQLAAGGTVFLDELADVPLSVQVKLLRVLEHQEVMPVGGNHSEALDVRILTATHQDLSRRIGEQSFREDLFFRLNVFPVHLPPLRDRPEDIPALAEHFLRKLEPIALPLQPRTVEYLTSRAWPGNVRELHNALEHAVILARSGPLLPEHFPPPMTPAIPNATQQLSQAVRDWLAERLRPLKAEDPPKDLYDAMLEIVEPALFEDVLRRLNGNRLVAAQWLGLNRATLRKKLRRGQGTTDSEPDE